MQKTFDLRNVIISEARPSVKKLFFLIALLLIVSSCVNSSRKISLEQGLHELIKNDAQTFSAFQNNDKILAYGLNSYFLSYEALLNKNYDKAEEISKKVLDTPGLTPTIYELMLNSFSLSIILSHEKNKDVKPNDYDYNSMLDEICENLCSSYGWHYLANKNSDFFTPERFKDSVINNNLAKEINLNFKYLNKNLFFIHEGSNQRPKFETDINDYIDGNDNSINEHPGLESIRKKALQNFREGLFLNSIKLFLSLKKQSNDTDITSMCDYWIARNYDALKETDKAKMYYLMAGSNNPLGLYDALAGQMLRTESGRTSSPQRSPFLSSLEIEKNKWPEYDFIKQEDLYKNSYTMDTLDTINTIKTSFLTIKMCIKKHKLLNTDEIQNYLLNESVSEKNLKLRKERFLEKYFLSVSSIWTKKKWLNISKQCCNKNIQTKVSSNLLWIDYQRGQFLEASLYINKIKNFIDLSKPENNFLYFVFYPLPYEKEFKTVANKYSIDPDVLYSIFRQQSLFYLEPEKNDLEKISEKISRLNKKYNYNLTHVLIALRAGEKNLDLLLKQQKFLEDDVFLIETIKDKKTSIFVQETLRNYYNIKWIYSEKHLRNTWWKKIQLFF